MSKQWILMGDIISSSDQAAVQLMESFKSRIAKANNEFDEFLLSPLTITLGDEFQGVVSSLGKAIEIIFRLDHAILQDDFKLRYSLNYGEIETRINPNVAHEMLGEGLTNARNFLNQLKGKKRRIDVGGIDAGFSSIKNDWLIKAFFLYQSLYDDWKPKDKLIAYRFIDGNDYNEVADIFNRDPSSMWRKKESLKIEEFTIAKKLILSIADEKLCIKHK